MPFRSRAQVEIVNDSSVAHHATRCGGQNPAARGDPLSGRPSGYFLHQRTIDISPAKALYSRAFQQRGRGKVVGLVMFSDGYNMDGDEFTFIDGSLTPQIHGDGTEDDHNQGWGGYAIQTPLWGGLINGFQGGYRLYTGEPYSSIPRSPSTMSTAIAARIMGRRPILSSGTISTNRARRTSSSPTPWMWAMGKARKRIATRWRDSPGRVRRRVLRPLRTAVAEAHHGRHGAGVQQVK